MDYMFFSALRDTPVKRINVSYDIVCQWECHLWERMLTLPSPMHLPHAEKTVVTFIPKFHLPAHVRECQWKYSFNYIQGSARTDGEAPERGWSTLNAVASSTKEMGPGHRRDTLDDLIGDSNWKKKIGLGRHVNPCLGSYLHQIGESILRKIIEAIPERNEHEEDLRELECSLSACYAKQLARWKECVEAWEQDMTQPNPFEVKSHCACLNLQLVFSDTIRTSIAFTQASIRLQLANDEAKLATESATPPMHLEISPSMLINIGIELEDQQLRYIPLSCHLCADCD